MEDPVVPLERNLWQFEKILQKYGWEKVSNWECLFVNRARGFFSSVYVDDIKLAGKKQNIDPMSSTASESPEQTRHESQFPLSSRTEQHQRTGRPVEDAYSSSYSQWNVDKTCSSQEWKSDELMEV